MHHAPMNFSLRKTLPAALLAFLSVAFAASVADAQRDVPPKPPLGLPAVQWPSDNPYSKEKAELGWLLYFDPRISSDQNVSCASCHAPEHAFTDAAPVSTGIGKQKGGRSAPTVINRAYSTFQFWDGRAPSLEEQAKGPLANPVEMTSSKDAVEAHRTVVANIKRVPGYVQR